MKPWQRGYDIERLKALAAPFLRDFKPHIYGAFGLPKERDVANALAAGEIAYTKAGAVAIFKRLASASNSSDFAGRVFRPQAGDLSIKAVAGWDNPLEVERLINTLCTRSRAAACWVEILEEIPQASATLEAMGFEYVGTKVAASSDLRGVYHRGERRARMPGLLAPAELAGLHTIRPEFVSPEEQEIILGELRAYEAQMPWAQHYSSYNKRKSWTAFALCGFSPDPSFIIKPSEMSAKWKQENEALLRVPCGRTAAWDAFPRTTALLSRLPAQRFQRLRFMRLAKAGGELSRHADITDPEAGTGDGQIARLHLPLQTHPACVFRSWGLRGALTERHLAERGLYYLDTRKPHQVRNGGDMDRIHLVIDVFSTEELRKCLQ